MNILQVIPFFAPTFGGSVTVPYELSQELVRKNHQITIITTDLGFDEEYANNLRKAGVIIIPFPCKYHIGLYIYTPHMKSWLQENIHFFDIIHMHNYRAYQNVIVEKYALKNEIPYIIQPHGSILPFFDKKILKKSFDLVWGNQLLFYSSQVIALTDTESEHCQLMGISKNKIKIIPNGLDISKCSILPSKGSFRKKHAIPHDKKIVLYVGRIHETKGVDLLIDSFNEMSKKRNDITLILIGTDDGYLNHLLQLLEQYNLSESVQILGFISQEEKIQAFIDADVFVTPSYSGFPITFLESMACVTPFVTTNRGDTLDWIDNNVGIVTDYDKMKLKNAIEKIIDNPELGLKFGNKGFQLIKSTYNWNSIADNIITLYQGCLKAG